jgi:hypothetical protein
VSEAVGDLYIEIRAKADKLWQDLARTQQETGKRAKDMEETFRRTRLTLDTTLAKKSLTDLEKMQATLKAKLQQKLSLGVDVASIQRTQTALSSIENKIKSIQSGGPSGTSPLAGWLAPLAGTVSSLFGAAAAMGVFKKSIDNAAQMEGFKTSLKVMLGSTQAAEDRLAEMVAFAASTPFEVPQVVALGNALQSIGKYSKENMTMLGDLASAAGKPIEQVTGAFQKLASGQKGIAVDMFRDMLITTNDWVAATGKGVSKSGEMLATTEEMLNALPKIIKSKNFAGMMEEQSKTFTGKLSNMMDAINQRLSKLGEVFLPIVGKMVESIGSIFSSTTTSVEAATIKTTKLKVRFEELAGTIGVLGSKVNRTAEEEKLFKQSQDELLAEYPNYFKGLDKNKTGFEDLQKGIAGARTELDKYISSTIQAALIQDKMAEIAAIGRDKWETQKKLTKDEAELAAGNFAASGSGLGGAGGGVGQGGAGARTRAQLVADIEARRGAMQNYERDLAAIQQEMNDIQKNFGGVSTAPSGGEGGPGGPPKPPSAAGDGAAASTLREQLAIERSLWAARQATLREMMDDDHQRELQAIEDRKALRMREIDDELKTASKEKPANERVVNAQRLIAEEEYQRDLIALRRRVMADWDNEDKKKDNKEGFVGPKPEDDWFATWAEQHRMIAEGMMGVTDQLSSNWNNSINGMLSGTMTFAEGVKSMWASIGSAVIGQISKMVAEWIAFKVLALGLSVASGGATSGLLIAHSGGNFLGTGNGVKKMAGGGSFIVPPGYSGDKYPLMVESGERVSVTPASSVARDAYDFRRLEARLEALTMNVVSQRDKGEMMVAVTGEITGKDIALANKRGTRSYNRIR